MNEIVAALKFAFTNKDKPSNIPDHLSKIGIVVLGFCELSQTISLEVDGEPVVLKIEEG